MVIIAISTNNICTEIEFPSNDQITLTHSETHRIEYCFKSREICTSFASSDVLIIATNIDVSMHFVVFANVPIFHGNVTETALDIDRYSTYIDKQGYHGSSSWCKLLFFVVMFVVMFVGYNYLFDCKWVYSSFLH